MGPSLAAELERTVGYTRIGFDVGDRTQVYLTANVARVKGINEPNAGTEKPGNLTIACDNPFLPASVQAACVAGYAAGADGVRRMAFGTSSGQFPETIDVVSARDQLRFVLGIDGAVDLFGTSWAYNGYVAHGTNHTRIDVNDISLTPRYNAAIDAVRLTDGSIVCRSAAARAAGCLPINIIGQNPVDPAALAYVFPAQRAAATLSSGRAGGQLQYQRRAVFAVGGAGRLRGRCGISRRVLPDRRRSVRQRRPGRQPEHGRLSRRSADEHDVGQQLVRG